MAFDHNLIFGAIFGGLLSIAYVCLVRGRFRQIHASGIRSPFNEDILTLPGHTARGHRSELLDALVAKYDQLLLWSVLLILTALLPTPTATVIAAIPCMAGVAYVLIHSARINDELHRVILQCDGEEYTGQELNYLWQMGACVFHDIPCGQGNIDHVVIGKDRLFAIETFTVNKRSDVKGINSSSNLASVSFNGETLQFPHSTTREPLIIARRNAESLEEQVKNVCGFDYPVVPVVAVPGWHVNVSKNAGTEVLVINPKRARGLKKWLGKKNESKQNRAVMEHISNLARSVPARSRRIDSNASDDFEFWLSSRYKDKILED